MSPAKHGKQKEGTGWNLVGPCSLTGLLLKRRLSTMMGFKPRLKLSLNTKKDCSCAYTIFLKTLDRDDSLEISLKLERTEGSKSCFLLNSCTVKCLKSVGAQRKGGID